MRLIHTIETDRGAVKVYRDSEWDQYVVRVSWRNPQADYFTDSKEDALATASVIADQQSN